MHSSKSPEQENPFKTILVIVLGFMGLSYFTHTPVMVFIAAGIAAMALMSGWTALKIHQGWMGLAKILGMVFPPFFMGVIYFCILTPMGLLASIFRKKPVVHSSSNYIPFEKKFTAEDLRNMW